MAEQHGCGKGDGCMGRGRERSSNLMFVSSTHLSLRDTNFNFKV